jgi:hypothetical protein
MTFVPFSYRRLVKQADLTSISHSTDTRQRRNLKVKLGTSK